MASPTITVATVCYNARETIEGAIESVRRYKDSSVEYVVVDGGSVDGTLEILSAYSHVIDVLVSEKDSGIYDAMNKVEEIASGDWLIFLGADDMLDIDLRELYPKLIDNEAIYYGNCRFLGSGYVYDGRFNGLKLFYRNICHQGILYPKHIYKSYKYDLNYPIRADHDYNINLYFKYSFKYLNETISVYNESGLSSLDSDTNFQRDRMMRYCSVAPFYYRLFVKIQKYFSGFLYNDKSIET